MFGRSDLLRITKPIERLAHLAFARTARRGFGQMLLDFGQQLSLAALREIPGRVAQIVHVLADYALLWRVAHAIL